MTHKNTHTLTHTQKIIFQSVLFNSKKQLYRVSNLQLVLIILYIIGSFFHLFSMSVVCVTPVCYSDRRMGLKDMHSSTVIETMSFMQPLCPDLFVCRRCTSLSSRLVAQINSHTSRQTQTPRFNIAKDKGRFSQCHHG